MKSCLPEFGKFRFIFDTSSVWLVGKWIEQNLSQESFIKSHPKGIYFP